MDSITVVGGSEAGDGCKVKINRILHEGKIVATGKQAHHSLCIHEHIHVCYYCTNKQPAYIVYVAATCTCTL